MHGTAGRGAGRIGGQAQRQQIRKQSKRTSTQMSGLSVFLLIAIALEKKSPGYRVLGIRGPSLCRIRKPLLKQANGVTIMVTPFALRGGEPYCGAGGATVRLTAIFRGIGGRFRRAHMQGSPASKCALNRFDQPEGSHLRCDIIPRSTPAAPPKAVCRCRSLPLHTHWDIALRNGKENASQISSRLAVSSAAWIPAAQNAYHGDTLQPHSHTRADVSATADPYAGHISRPPTGYHRLHQSG